MIVVHTATLQARSDFETIRAKLAERAPDIEVFIVDNQSQLSVTRRRAERRPTLVFSPVPLLRFRPLRGKVYAGVVLTKMEQIRRLGRAGLHVPDTVLLEPATYLDPCVWGELIVLKPEGGQQGIGVHLRRTREVRWFDPQSWPRNDPRHGKLLMAQKFIDTGAIPSSHRVLTVFGRPVYSALTRLLTDKPIDLEADSLDEPIAANLYESDVVSDTGERGYELNYEEDVLAFAREVARVFPEIPVLGVDILREKASRQLWVIEVNPSGLTWHISSDFEQESRVLFDLDFASQFGAFDIITDALIEVTRREAE